MYGLNIFYIFNTNYMPNYLTNVMCYDFTFPIGMINSLITTIDFCSDISTDSTDLSNDNTDFKSALKTGSDIDVLNESITHTLIHNFQQQHISQTTTNKAVIKNPHGLGDENGCLTCGHNPTKAQLDNFSVLSENENTPYKLPTRNVGSNPVKSYFCDTRIDQTSNQTLTKIAEISTEVKHDIIDQITGHISDTLSKRGSSKDNIDATIKVISNVHNKLVENIDTSVNQITDQDINVILDITYIDNYGVCAIENGKSTGKIIKQKNDVKTISKNIINTTIDIIMENDVSIDSETNTVINNITNRIVFGSILWNLLSLLIIYYIIKAL